MGTFCSWEDASSRPPNLSSCRDGPINPSIDAMPGCPCVFYMKVAYRRSTILSLQKAGCNGRLVEMKRDIVRSVRK